MRIDLLLIILAVILLTAMALTLLFGKEYSRHGYGTLEPKLKPSHLTYTI